MYKNKNYQKEYYDSHKEKNKDRIKEYHKDYYLKNKEKILQYQKENKEKTKEQQKEWYETNKIKIQKRMKIYRDNHKIKTKEYMKEYRKLNKQKIKENRKEYTKNHIKETRTYVNNKYKTDSNFKLALNYRKRIYKALKDISKSTDTLKLLDCSIIFLKQYLEKQFGLGMSWSNYGYYGWHIDHIKPCASFDLSKPSEQRKCFHYTNLQPLWAEDNLVKNKY